MINLKYLHAASTIILSGFLLLSLYSVVSANTAYEVDFTISLAPEQITNVGDGVYLGKQWRVDIPVNPITINIGDSISGTISFDNYNVLILADNGGGFFTAGSVAGFENLYMLFSHSGGNIITNSNAYLRFNDVVGPLLINPLVQDGVIALHNYNGLFEQFFENIIDPFKQFSFRGFDYQIVRTVDTLGVAYEGPIIVNNIAFEFQSESITIDEVDPTSCVGFMAPLDDPAEPVMVKNNNRVLPIKAQLFDVNGFMLTDEDLDPPPKIQVVYEAGSPDEMDVTADALGIGLAKGGTDFIFVDDKWQYNLKLKNFEDSGKYTVILDLDGQYALDPRCEGMFIIK